MDPALPSSKTPLPLGDDKLEAVAEAIDRRDWISVAELLRNHWEWSHDPDLADLLDATAALAERPSLIVPSDHDTPWCERALHADVIDVSGLCSAPLHPYQMHMRVRAERLLSFPPDPRIGRWAATCLDKALHKGSIEDQYLPILERHGDAAIAASLSSVRTQRQIGRAHV